MKFDRRGIKLPNDIEDKKQTYDIVLYTEANSHRSTLNNV